MLALGFFGIKKHQGLSQTGMIFGAFSVLFVNIMNLEKIKELTPSLISFVRGAIAG